jgi:hypothetical protein
MAVVLQLSACGEEDSPEAQVRHYLAEAESAVEGREIIRVQGLISEHYADTAKRSRQDLVRLVGGYFLRHKSIHLLTRIERLQIKEAGEAEVVLYVAMAGSPIKGAEQLPGIQVDLHRFELLLGQDASGAWQLLNANWRHAMLDDFSPES